jgi:hypothetical protein
LTIGLATASQAHGTRGDVVACTFSGLSGQLADDDNGLSGSESIATDHDIAMEHGTYDLSARAGCSRHDAATGSTELGNPSLPTPQGGNVPPVGGHNADLVSHGDYYTTLCGTGTWTDSRGATELRFHSGPVLGFDYEIDFRAMAGTMEISTDEVFGVPYAGRGVVRIEPVSPGNCVTTDVAEFEVYGQFSFVGR